MGTGGDNLRNISTETGAKVIRKEGEVYIVSGTRQQRQQARAYIGHVIVSFLLLMYFIRTYINPQLRLIFFSLVAALLGRCRLAKNLVIYCMKA